MDANEHLIRQKSDIEGRLEEEAIRKAISSEGEPALEEQTDSLAAELLNQQIQPLDSDGVEHAPIPEIDWRGHDAAQAAAEEIDRFLGAIRRIERSAIDSLRNLITPPHEADPEP